MTLKQAHNKGLGAVSDYSSIVDQASATYGVPVDLINAVITAESGGDPNSLSPTKAMGLMQLEPGTASDLGVTNPYDPTQNIMGGTRYLSQLLSQAGGDVSQALAAYNFGPGNVFNKGLAWPNETVNYVNKILGFLGISSAIGPGGTNVPNVDVNSLLAGSSDLSQAGYTDFTGIALIAGAALVGFLLLREIL